MKIVPGFSDASLDFGDFGSSSQPLGSVHLKHVNIIGSMSYVSSTLGHVLLS